MAAAIAAGAMVADVETFFVQVRTVWVYLAAVSKARTVAAFDTPEIGRRALIIEAVVNEIISFHDFTFETKKRRRMSVRRLWLY